MDQDFAQNFIRGFEQGQQIRTRKRKEEQEDEDRVIEKELLQHRLKELKITDKIRARDAARENLSMLQGKPENTFRNATDEDMQTGGAPATGIGGLPASVVPVRKPTVNIPGIEELGVPGISQQPDTMEEILGQKMTASRMAERGKVHEVNRGAKAVLPAYGNEPEEVLAEGDPFMIDRTERGPDGITKTTRVTEAQNAALGPEIQHPLPTRLGSSRLTPEERKSIKNAFVKGLAPIDRIPESTEGLRVIGDLGDAGIDMVRARADIIAYRTFLTGLNDGTTQQTLMAADGALESLDALDAVIARTKGQWKFPNSSASNELKAAAARVLEYLPIIRSGGAAPTTALLVRADEELGTGLFGDGLETKVKRLRDAIEIRVASIKGAYLSSESQGVSPPPRPNGATAPVGGGSATTPTGPTDAAIAAALDAKGYDSSPASVATAKGNAAIMAELFPR